MAARITVWAAHRVITGQCEKRSDNNYGSDGTSHGHEWEARVGIEDYLDSATMASAESLHAAIVGKQTLVLGLVRSQLLAQGAPAELIDSQPGKLQTSVAPAPEPAPAPSQEPVATQQPPKRSAAWGGPKKPAPAQEAEQDDDGPPPKNGRQLLGWAHKQQLDMADWIFNWAKSKKRGKVVEFGQETTSECFAAARKALAKQIAEIDESEDES